MMRYQRQKGLSLVELMVAMVLSLFLLAGVITIFVNTKTSYSGQEALAALQENERLAASVLANTIRQAGYFPVNGTTPTNGYAFPPNNLFKTAGQVIYGTGSTIYLRYVTAPNDGLIGCNGQTNTGATQLPKTNIISMDSGKYALECAVIATGSNSSGTSHRIISPLGDQPFNPNGGGISGMQVLYGVGANTLGSVDQYMNASQITTNDAWVKVRSVMITLDFENPLYDANHPDGQPQTLPLTRVINLQNLSK